LRQDCVLFIVFDRFANGTIDIVHDLRSYYLLRNTQ
jgi:hypothetical protein